MEPINDIVHAVNWFLPDDRDGVNRLVRAYGTWRFRPRWRTFLFIEGQYPRSSRDIGDTRNLPYVRDIIDHGVAIGTDAAIIVFTNADICLTAEAPDAVLRAMDGKPCCFARRVDVETTKQLAAADLADKPKYFGVDLFAVRPRFWRQHAAELPDVFLACEQWDLVYKHLTMPLGNLLNQPYEEIRQRAAECAANSNPPDNSICRDCEWACKI